MFMRKKIILDYGPISHPRGTAQVCLPVSTLERSEGAVLSEWRWRLRMTYVDHDLLANLGFMGG
jgi:hypothetical protein